jgi:diaminopimelate decarboxylase
VTNMTTPYFVIDKMELDNNVISLQQALADGWGRYIIGYSFKTNSLPWVTKHLQGHHCFAEVVSSPEYELALHMGYDKSQIIFNGPVKGKAEFEDAVLSGAIVNIDSRREIEWVRDLSRTSGSIINVGIRVNVELEDEYSDEMGYPDDGSRFGFSLSTGDFYDVVTELQSVPNVRITGQHLHLTSKTRSLKVYQQLARTACQVKRTTAIPFSYVDIGGGFFGGVPGRPSFREYVNVIANELRTEFDPEETTLIVEPGSALIASPVTFVTEVIDVKDTSKSRIVTIDGSRTNVDPLMIKTKHFYDLNTQSDKLKDKQTIVGFTCMETDRIMVLRNEREMQVGDQIIFKKVGAYTMSLNPLFIQYFPRVYVFDGDSYAPVRDQWAIDEFLQKNVW